VDLPRALKGERASTTDGEMDMGYLEKAETMKDGG
jgi:hypothetical protein